MEHRLAELEVRLSLTEDLVEALNLTVYRQQQQIDLLQQQLRHLYRCLQEPSPAVEKRSPHDEIPPHY
ncbi:SlyX family protein [Candidatus Accumulibacter sp. ACC007]|uniref:SlyX family protein n=1 Tax=Candidatus Accumulibacter sp. ACC007 TaxID=2823333 RepID=UPI0025C0B31C|nr:SlyX family protein [Candidatus Accumulibacter sp. ACC007]